MKWIKSSDQLPENGDWIITTDMDNSLESQCRTIVYRAGQNDNELDKHWFKLPTEIWSEMDDKLDNVILDVLNEYEYNCLDLDPSPTYTHELVRSKETTADILALREKLVEASKIALLESLNRNGLVITRKNEN